MTVLEPIPDAREARAACQYQPGELSVIDVERWAEMSEVERARALLRMRSRDAALYRELVANYLDCTR